MDADKARNTNLNRAPNCANCRADWATGTYEIAERLRASSGTVAGNGLSGRTADILKLTAIAAMATCSTLIITVIWVMILKINFNNLQFFCNNFL